MNFSYVLFRETELKEMEKTRDAVLTLIKGATIMIYNFTLNVTGYIKKKMLLTRFYYFISSILFKYLSDCAQFYTYPACKIGSDMIST